MCSSDLEAVVHALYELIERYYTARFEEGELTVEALHEEELALAGVDEFLQGDMRDYELQLYAGEIPGIKNLPFVFCIITGPEQHLYAGYGCSATVEISIDRAISEALQSHATLISGAREDMEFEIKKETLFLARHLSPKKEHCEFGIT